jgi:hypothetical protein
MVEIPRCQTAQDWMRPAGRGVCRWGRGPADMRHGILLDVLIEGDSVIHTPPVDHLAAGSDSMAGVGRSRFAGNGAPLPVGSECDPYWQMRPARKPMILPPRYRSLLRPSCLGVPVVDPRRDMRPQAHGSVGCFDVPPSGRPDTANRSSATAGIREAVEG